MSPTTVLLGTTLTKTIKRDKHGLRLLGSNRLLFGNTWLKKLWDAKLTVFCDFEQGRNVELKFDKWNHKTTGKTL